MLKIIACLTMLVDHVGYTFFPQQLWLRVIGRIAFPLFCWYVARGFSRTRSRRKYLARLALWGVVSQIPFALLFYHASFDNPLSLLKGLNVMFTFCFALVGLWLIDVCRGRHWGLQLLSWAAYALLGVAAGLLHTDYDLYGVLLVLLCYAFGMPRPATAAAGAGTAGTDAAAGTGTAGMDAAAAAMPQVPAAPGANPGGTSAQIRWKPWNLMLPGSVLLLTYVFVQLEMMSWLQLFCVAAIPLLWLRLPDPAPGRWKHAFYAFYPAHILVLYVMAVVIR